MNAIRMNDFLKNNEPAEIFRTSLKRKLFNKNEDLSLIELDIDQGDCKVKRLKSYNLKNSLIEKPTNEFNLPSIPTIFRNQFKKRILNNYSNKKLLNSLSLKRRKSISKPFLNLNNLSIFDTKSVYKFKFEQIIKRVFDKIQNCSLDDDYSSLNDAKNILDLNQLFQFNGSNLDSVFDDDLMSSLKASFLGKGSFGKVFKTRLEHKCYAIKIGLSNSFYGCVYGEENALFLNEHPNVVKTHHILKLKLTSDDQLLKKNKVTPEDHEFPMVMSTNISYHTMKYIIDLNLLKLIDLFPKHKFFSTLNVIIMEYAGDFSLQQLIDDSVNEKITKKRRINFAKQIADALVYLKCKQIAHLDLKPANIMIRRTDDFLKLIDFGCSKKNYQLSNETVRFQSFDGYESSLLTDQLSASDKENHNLKSCLPAYLTNNYNNKLLSFENTIMSSLIKSGKKLIGQNQCNIGTISHTAPEIFRNDTVTNIFQADVYSFSIILWQLVTREIPYSGDNIHSIIYRVASGKLRPKFESRFHLDEKNYYDLTVKMWNNIPEKRPTIEFIFQTLNKKF